MAGGTYSRQENGPALSHPLNLLGVIYLGEPPSVPPPESLALGHNKEGGKATGAGEAPGWEGLLTWQSVGPWRPCHSIPGASSHFDNGANPPLMTPTPPSNK